MQFKSACAHTEVLSLFQSHQGLSHTFAGSEFEAWLEETVLNLLTLCLSQTGWFDTYSTIIPNDRRQTWQSAAFWPDTRSHDRGQ